MAILAVEPFLLELPLREPFVAAHGTTTGRTIAVVRVKADEGWGWGECSALPAATYSAESAAGSFDALAGQLAPELLGVDLDHGLVVQTLARYRDRPMAVSALEMAVLDVELRRDGRSLAQWFGAERATVPAGVSIGLAPVPDTIDTAVALAGDGYRRIKAKIEPGHDLDLVAGLRSRLPNVELHVDANGAYGPADVDHLVTLVDLGVDAVEQPFPADEPGPAAALIEALAGRAVPVVADEAVTSLEGAVDLAERRALTGLSIKPGRIGGLGAARDLHRWCRRGGIPATAGGMLETGLGRRALAALAALPGFTLTGDLSPARRWLVTDPWPDLEMQPGVITVPTGPGIAPDPDPDLLSMVTEDHRVVS